MKPTERIGDPPEYFEDSWRSIWAEIAELAGVGVLTADDRLIAAGACYLINRIRTSGHSPEVYGTLEHGLRELRFGPVEIAKLAAAKRTRASDAWAQLAGTVNRRPN